MAAITETLSYNIQGWLTEKTSDVFDMRLRYYDPSPGRGSAPSFAGNISEWEWTHKGAGIASPQANTYAFSYDKLSRLTDIGGCENMASRQIHLRNGICDYAFNWFASQNNHRPSADRRPQAAGRRPVEVSCEGDN